MGASTVCLLAAIGFVVSWSSVPDIRRWCHASDRHQPHHTHSGSICRLGGLALALAFALLAGIGLLGGHALSGSWQPWTIVGASLAMFALGFCDDLRPMGAKRKLAGQILIASAVYYAGIEIGHFKNPITGFDHNLGYWSYFATVFWLVSLTNLINLIDGVDGLAAGISLMMMVLLSFVALHSNSLFSATCTVGTAGALAGFLIYNFPPASIYLGDGGAYFLGFLIGILSLTQSQKGTVTSALIAPLFVLALPIVDVSLAILRRGLKGLPLFRPDRSHLHHRLQSIGLSRTRVVLGFYSCTLFFLLLAFGVFLSNGRWLGIAFGLGCAVLLVSARTFSFSREWFAIGKVLGNSIELRRQARYALSLAHWLELEAERCSGPDDLWRSFGFTIGKIGFSSVTLTTPTGTMQWPSPTTPSPQGQGFPMRKLRALNSPSSLEFQAYPSAMTDRAFDLLTELATESWSAALKRWQQTHRRRLDSATMRRWDRATV